ncbi:hypothetical protein D3C71_1624150 [compost metagenome]
MRSGAQRLQESGSQRRVGVVRLDETTAIFAELASLSRSHACQPAKRVGDSIHVLGRDTDTAACVPDDIVR